jgi:hypothetical protein
MPLEQSQGNNSLVDTQAGYLQDLGVGWWRSDFPIANVSPQKGKYNWGAADYWVKKALSIGVKPLPICYILPGWMHNGSGTYADKTPPTNNADYSTWCVEAAKYFKSIGVTAMELWNEQNLSPAFWNVSGPNDSNTRQKYAAMIKDAYPKIKAAVPDMLVIVGGISTSDSMASNPNPPGCGALATIQRYGELGVFSNCDAMAWHPYLDTDTPCKDVGNWPSWSPKAVAAALGIIDQFAPGRGVGLWSTEGGCPRSAVGGNEGTQSQRAQDAYKALMPNGCLYQYRTRLGPYWWFCVVDRTTGDGREDSFGMVRTNGQKHQVYGDMKNLWATSMDVPAALAAAGV